ncbi:hypothetical protein J3R82DRAFT_6236 [Butyriboletus roseoflavus]|nr:hypothetical protein J3R82DRAFT_6236 [Butyriboletus roseoflavus]
MLDTLGSLEWTYDCLMMKVDAFYAFLNVCDKFSKLKGISFDFIQIHLLMWDLKINIRKQAIGSSFKWDKLDQVVGGAQQALDNNWIFVVPQGF